MGVGSGKSQKTADFKRPFNLGEHILYSFIMLDIVPHGQNIITGMPYVHFQKILGFYVQAELLPGVSCCVAGNLRSLHRKISFILGHFQKKTQGRAHFQQIPFPMSDGQKSSNNFQALIIELINIRAVFLVGFAILFLVIIQKVIGAVAHRRHIIFVPEKNLILLAKIMVEITIPPHYQTIALTANSAFPFGTLQDFLQNHFKLNISF